MKVKITPSKAVGSVIAPPSKSIAHRALICAALSNQSIVLNVALSNDISATLNCLKSLGANAKLSENSVDLKGLSLKEIPDETVLYCNESGSTLRFLIPLCLLTGKKITLKGSKRLFERPLSIYESICTEQGLFFQKGEDLVTVCGVLKSGNYKVSGEISSQFISGLLFALPLLDGISIVEVTGRFESASYIDLTLSVLSDFGIRITRAGNRFIIYGNQTYQNTRFNVEGDYSNAAFLDVFNFIGGDVTVNGLSAESEQGDRVYKEMFSALDNGYKEFDMTDCPDLAPIMFALASVKGGARFIGTSRLKIKESDRASVMAQELSKFGIPVEVGENYVIVGKAELTAPITELCGHNDHRIVMALSVLCTLVGGTINGAEAVSKSYPDFFEMLKSLGIGIEIYDT